MAAIKTDNLSNSNLMIVMLLISLLAVGVAGIIGKTLVTAIIRDTKVVQKKSTADDHLSQDINNAQPLIDSYNALSDKAKILADALPTTPDFPSLIVTLENMGTAAGLQMKSVTPSPNSDATATGSGNSNGDASIPPSPQPYKFGISFSGSYTSLSKFLGEIENSARPMKVLDIQMAGGGSSLTGQIDVTTYYQAQAVLPFSQETVK